MTTPTKSIYQRLVEAGCEIDHWQSDLYAKVTPQSTEIVNSWAAEQKFPVGQFLATDGSGMWFDIPFQFMAEKRLAK